MQKCFGRCNALCRVELKKALEQIDRYSRTERQLPIEDDKRK
jgi:hypothetical protein